MDLLFSYHQQKKDKHRKPEDNVAQCLIRLYIDNDNICYEGMFDFDYDRYGSKIHVTFEHALSIDTVTGDVSTSYKISNTGLPKEKSYRNLTKKKKNDFKLVFDLIENGIARGEKRKGYWGVKYDRAVNTIVDFLVKHLQPKLTSKHFIGKNYTSNHFYNSIYDIIVDFHLDMKGIKAHDNIYYDIQNEYPKKKWLEKNDRKYLPAILDSYGIKSKYLIAILNKSNVNVSISALNYISKLFGENHVEYLKKINWEVHCYEVPPNKKTHELRNESEKDFMINVINTWEKDSLRTDSLIYSVNKLLTIRELLETKGLNLKFKAKNDFEFDNLLDSWQGLKLYFGRGYRVRYVIPNEIRDEIEKEIIIDGLTFKPKLILSEDEFRIEGYVMKNCMAKQFLHGAIYLFVSLQHKRKRINLQYRKGNLVQSYGKANTAVLPLFESATNALTNRFKKHTNLHWNKEKYDFISD
jgi:hypothetical protein